ncbi:MAG: nucleotidyltransferase domain-containing protein [Actinopolymorphaceae bacterium]
MTSLERARRLVDTHLARAFPEVAAALLSGSVARGRATATSDVDLVVLLPDGGGSRRETVEWDGVTVDLFAYDPPGLDRWLAADTERRRPVLCSLILDGILVAGVPDVAADAKARARGVLAAGPRPLTDAERLRMRYGATDLLLDVESSTDRAETLLLAAALVQTITDLTLSAAGRWTGAGKWLVRELRAYDRGRADALADAHDALARHDTKSPLLHAVDDLLALRGGRYLIGRADQG